MHKVLRIFRTKATHLSKVTLKIDYLMVFDLKVKVCGMGSNHRLSFYFSYKVVSNYIIAPNRPAGSNLCFVI